MNKYLSRAAIAALAIGSMTMTGCSNDIILDGIVNSILPQLETVSTSNYVVFDGTGFKRSKNLSVALINESFLREVFDPEEGIMYAHNSDKGEFFVENSCVNLCYSQDDSDDGLQSWTVFTGKEVDGNMIIEKDTVFADLQISIINKMENLSLEVVSVELHNIAKKGTLTFEENPVWSKVGCYSSIVVEKEKTILECGDSILWTSNQNIAVIPQKVDAWNPVQRPGRSQGGYILLECIINDNAGGDDIPIWCDSDKAHKQLAIPFGQTFISGTTSVINIIMDENCPWYDIDYSVPQKVLQEIIFDANVEDWNDEDRYI